MRIGRGADAELRLVHPAVSSNHAVVSRVAGQMILADRGSDLGTEVNGVRATACAVTPLDRVAIGPYRLRLWCLNPPPRRRLFGEGLREISTQRDGPGWRRHGAAAGGPRRQLFVDADTTLASVSPQYRETA